ncbi:MAG: tRNA (adenosine(37)-N6)-dimethylallyltransferase MiaA, partial [Anaerolineales bacterium]
MISDNKKFLVIIVGPTAVGKTAVSIQLAQRLNAEIVSADSRLFYRGMSIGTAKPMPGEMKSVRHYLIDVADPNEVWSLALFQQNAYRAINDILARGKLPFLVGGTGQYIRAIVEGWQIPPQTPDYGLREVLTHWANEIGAEALHVRLRRLDAPAAEKIDYRNLRRTVRALEVIFSTGERFSGQRRKKGCLYNPIMLGIQRPRDELYARIDRRVDQMIAQGFVNEVQGLLDAGYSPNLPTMSAIGYA